jgi:hypothetical protein
MNREPASRLAPQTPKAKAAPLPNRSALATIATALRAWK